MLPGLVWASGLDGAVGYFNKSCLEEEQGENWTHGIHSDDLERRVAAFKEAVSTRSRFRIEYRLRHHDGSYRWIADEGGPVSDDNGNLTGFVGCCVELEKPFGDGKVDAANAAAADRQGHGDALPILAGIMAHEFNNLLTPIFLNLSMAQSQLNGYTDEVLEEVKRRLFETEAAALRAKELSTHLLAFGKGGNPVKKSVEPIELVETAIAKALEGGTIAATFTHAADLQQIDVDRAQFDSVIERIVANAVDAMPSGGEIHVSTELVEIPDPELKRLREPQFCIRIEDEGPGIRFDVGDRIFDPYFSTRPGAEGLGLTTAQAVVRNHSGDMVTDPESGNGATFMIYFPVAAAPAENHEQGTEAAAAAASKTVQGQGHILIMDDEDLVRSNVAAILKAYGYEVEMARDGAEALELYTKARESNNSIDCALMDLTIHGGMGGKEAVGRLRLIDSDAKAVVCSGHSNDLIMDKFQMYGFRGAIKKPFHPDELNRLLQKLIHS